MLSTEFIIVNMITSTISCHVFLGKIAIPSVHTQGPDPANV